jgi:hypothetical protein
MQDVGDREVGGLGRRKQERCEVARARRAPERVVGGMALAVLADAEERRGRAPGTGP